MGLPKLKLLRTESPSALFISPSLPSKDNIFKPDGARSGNEASGNQQDSEQQGSIGGASGSSPSSGNAKAEGGGGSPVSSGNHALLQNSPRANSPFAKLVRLISDSGLPTLSLPGVDEPLASPAAGATPTEFNSILGRAPSIGNPSRLSRASSNLATSHKDTGSPTEKAPPKSPLLARLSSQDIPSPSKMTASEYCQPMSRASSGGLFRSMSLMSDNDIPADINDFGMTGTEELKVSETDSGESLTHSYQSTQDDANDGAASLSVVGRNMMHGAPRPSAAPIERAGSGTLPVADTQGCSKGSLPCPVPGRSHSSPGRRRPRKPDHRSLLKVKSQWEGPSSSGSAAEVSRETSPAASFRPGRATSSRNASPGAKTNNKPAAGRRRSAKRRGSFEYEDLAPSSGNSTPKMHHKLGRKKIKRDPCVSCGTLDTPQWRVGLSGKRDLCNACGVRFRKGLLQLPGQQ